MQEMSQADFARTMGVSRAAVSQWKAKDILQADAFTGEGKTGKVRVAIAMDQVRRNRDIGQSLGNGIGTRTTQGGADPVAVPAPPVPEADISAPVPAAPPAVMPLAPVLADPAPLVLPDPAFGEGDADAGPARAARIDTVEDQLKRAKLEEQLRRNRMQASEEAQRSGQLMDVADAREQMARIAVMMLQIFEGALPDFAEALSERFDVPQRDVLHLMRAKMADVRRTAAMKERTRADLAERDAVVRIGGDD